MERFRKNWVLVINKYAVEGLVVVSSNPIVICVPVCTWARVCECVCVCVCVWLIFILGALMVAMVVEAARKGLEARAYLGRLVGSDGWMERWMDGWMDGWMVAWLKGCFCCAV